MSRGSKLGAKQRTTLRKINPETLKGSENIVKYLVMFGVLAPSTHNTQPWKVKISGLRLEIYADFSKGIPEADPSGRDLYMSVGAFIKNIELAAFSYGLEFTTLLHTDLKEKSYLATVEFVSLEKLQKAKDQPTLEAIISRQNMRGFFKEEIDHKTVRAILAKIRSRQVHLSCFFDEETREKLASHTAEGLSMAYKDPNFRREISSYINHNLSKKRHGLHGYSLRMSLPVSVIVPKIVKRKDIGAKLSKLNYDSFISAPGAVVFSGLDEPDTWLKTGMALEQMMVELSKHGIYSSIYAAAIEMGDLRRQVTKLLKDDKNYVAQLIVCIGHAQKPLKFSVRKDPKSIITR